MVPKIFKTGNSLVVSLPKETIQTLGLDEGSEVDVAVNAKDGSIIIKPVKKTLANIEPAFAQQLADFIEEYRPALEALAK